MAEESETAQEIEALKAIWPELQDRPPVWNSPAVAVPVCPLGSLDAKRPTRVTVVVIFNPRYPKVPPRLELESPSQLSDDEVAKLKHMLEVKAADLAGTDMVMVHDLLVLTNDFLSDKNRADEERSRSKGESLFQKMLTEEQRQRDKREEEEREEEIRQRDEEAKQLLEEEAKGEAHWAVVREKLEQKKERASVGFVGVMEGVIPEMSAGGVHSEEEDDDEQGGYGAGGAGGGQRGDLKGEAGEGAADEEESSASDDSWMNDLDDNNNPGAGGVPRGGGGGVQGEGGALKERTSWYRSQFKELENLGKGGFGTVVKVRNRVDRRLYAVKKVGLDPFDKQTNRKIRREVTTISTLIHKNIVRYYQAWLEGGGGAFPAAVAEDENDDDDDDDNDDDDDDERGRGGDRDENRNDNDNDNDNDTATSADDATGGRGDKEGERPPRPTNLNAAAALTAAGKPTKRSGRGGTGTNLHQPADEEEDGEEDHSETEAGLGFFRTTPNSSTRTTKTWKPKHKKLAGLEGEGKTAAAAMGGDDYGYGSGYGSGVRFDNDAGRVEERNGLLERVGESEGVGDGGRVATGRKAKRLLRKQVRKKKRLLAAATAGGTTARTGVKGKGRRGGRRVGQRTPTGATESSAATATATPAAVPEKTQAPLAGTLWARKRRGSIHSSSFGSGGAESSSSSPSSSESESSGPLAAEWPDGAEGEGVSGGGGSEGSWGSGSGDYHAHGQGKLVSDAEFFQFCGSPERVRQESAQPPLPASWSSEDALMHHYKQARRNRGASRLDRGDRGPASSSHSSALARPSAADQSLASPSLLPGGAATGDGHNAAGREKGATRTLDALISPPTPHQPAMRAAGERQFLYIQMEYCENTLRHLIDHGELWREEQRCWRLFRQMLEGVDFIHSKGIIHRDLTPPNVFLDGEENVKLGDFGLATSKKARSKVVADIRQKRGLGVNSPSSDDEYSSNSTATTTLRDHSTNADPTNTGGGGGTGSVQSSAFGFPSAFGEALSSMSGDTSQLTDGVGTGPYIAPEQGARFGQYNHKADMWSLGVILFEMLAPRFSTLMERAEVMTALRAEGEATFPPAFEERVPDNAKQVIRWLLSADADSRPTAAELLSSALLPPKLEVEASFLREALRVMGNPDSDTFQVVVKALLDQETAEHVEHWYDHEPLGTVAARIPIEAPAVSYVCDGLRRVFETHGATPVAPPTIRPKPPPSLAAPPAASKGLVSLLDHKGAVVMLPGNLTAPFARFVARSGVTRLKRYQIDRIFLAAGPERSCTEAWEADFDIISSCPSPSEPSSSSSPFYGAGYSRAVLGGTSSKAGGGGLDDARGGGRGGQFEVAEAEAVLVVSQVMGAFETFVGPWFLRLGNVNMSQAILELCGVPQDARSTLTGLLGKLTRGSVTPAKAFSEVESKGVLSAEAIANVRPFLQHVGVKDKNPFDALGRLEVLVHRIPAVKSVLGLTGSSGRRSREIGRKEAVRTKRSLRVFRESWEGLKTLVEGLARLGIIPLPPSLRGDHVEEETAGSKTAGSKKGSTSSVQGAGTRRGKGSGRRRQRSRGDGAASRDGLGPNSADRDRDKSNSRADVGAAGRGGDRSDGGGARASGGGDNSVARTGGEVNQESWKGGVVPAFVVVDLGLTQRQGTYASGTVFQAVLIRGGSLSGGSSSRSRGPALSLTVAEGGRYDDLVAKHRYHLRSASNKVSGASGLCAVGVRFAVEKLASMLVTPRNDHLSGPRNQHHPQATRRSRAVDAVVCAGGGFEPQELQERVLVAARLWAGGIRAEYLATDALVRAGAGKGGGLEGAAEACLSLGIPFVVVVRPHTLLAKKAVKVMSVMEKGGGQLEVPLDHLAQHVADALAALADPAPTQGGPSGGASSHHHHHQPSSTPGSLASSGGAKARLELVDRGQGPLEREKMSRQEFKTFAALERRVGTLLDTTMAGPVEGKRDGDGPLVLGTDASFAGVRGLTTCYMLYGSDSKALAELLADHPEKKVLRNLLAALQEVFVYSLLDEMMDLVTFSPSGN
eukprot:g8853.t3